MNLPLSTAARIAWRETRASWVKFFFVVLGVAAGVGALAGVRGFSQSFDSMLKTEARTVMAADLTARQFVVPSQAQIELLDQLAAKGVDRSLITETVSMASSTVEGAIPALVSLKAVEPSKYPYYGIVKLSPPISLTEALTIDSVAAAEDLLIRLGLKVGDVMRLGGEDFRVAAIVQSEPDRMSGSLNVGLRLMMSREALARTGLLQLGSRSATRLLFKLGPLAPPVDQVRMELKRALPEALIADFRQSHPLITRGLDRATIFLSLVSLIALIVGAIGVGMAMHSHLQQKMDHIAVMKSLGGTSREIIRIYTLQTLMLGLLGGLGGVLVGRAIETVFPALISRLFAIDIRPTWHFQASFQAIASGVLTTLLFTLPPLLAIRKIRPALILRRDMPEAKLPWTKRLGEVKGALGVGGIILCGLGAIAAWLAGSPRVGGYFAAGLSGSLLILAAVASGLMRGLREFLKRSPWKLSSLTRQGLANLYRQGNQAQAILVSLGLGVMFTLTVYLVQSSLVKDILATAPPGAPNVFLVGVTQAQSEPLRTLIESQDGVLGKVTLAPSAAARLVSIDDAPLPDNEQRGVGRRFTNTRSVTWADAPPDDVHLQEGAWWDKQTQEPVLSVSDEAAKILQLHPGAVTEWQASGKTIRARVLAIHDTQAVRNTPTPDFVFNRQALAGLPVVYYGGVRMRPNAVGALQRATFKAFPTVTVVNIADALEIVQQVVDQVALVIRFLSGFSILAGAIILAASVAGTRFRRVREVVILKTLGGTRAAIQRIFSIEFLTLGAVAGLLGSVLATVFSSLILKRLLEAKFSIDWVAVLTAVVLSAVLANLSGWMASFRILGQKPLEVLRQE